MKRLALVLLVAIGVVVGVLVFRAVTFPSRQPPLESAVTVDVDADVAANRFAGAIRFPTISYLEEGRTDSAAFRGLHASPAGRVPPGAPAFAS
jgi:carboxypeptidase PM20D1